MARHRLQLTSEFFDHVENLIHAAHQDQQQREGKKYGVDVHVQQAWLSYWLADP